MGFTTTGRCPAGGPDPDRAAWADQVTGVALTVAGRMIGACVRRVKMHFCGSLPEY